MCTYKVRHWIESGYLIFVKSYEFLFLAENMSKRLTTKYKQKILDYTKQFAADAPKMPKKRNSKSLLTLLLITLHMILNLK